MLKNNNKKPGTITYSEVEIQKKIKMMKSQGQTPE
jgi:hypothetical protein